jgi:2-keto-4-pentenoate hydratase
VVGHKIGLTPKAMQSQSRVKEPDHGCLLDDTVFANGAEIPAGTFTAHRGSSWRPSSASGCADRAARSSIC